MATKTNNLVDHEKFKDEENNEPNLHCFHKFKDNIINKLKHVLNNLKST